MFFHWMYDKPSILPQPKLTNPAVCHKVSHINCCNGLSCEMTDNPNGDYGICRASDENRDNDDRCMCSMSGGKNFKSKSSYRGSSWPRTSGVCHPKSDVNCCFGLFCDMTNNANGDYGKCRPSNESRNPLKKVEDDEDNCLVPGCMLSPLVHHPIKVQY